MKTKIAIWIVVFGVPCMGASYAAGHAYDHGRPWAAIVFTLLACSVSYVAGKAWHRWPPREVVEAAIAAKAKHDAKGHP